MRQVKWGIRSEVMFCSGQDGIPAARPQTMPGKSRYSRLMDEYIAVLYAIVTQGRNTNSYKFALWRALANLAANTDERIPKVSKRDLALLFVSYYWPLEVRYHIRQGIDPDKDPIVMRLIRQLAEAGKISRLRVGEGANWVSRNAIARRSASLKNLR
jgi:hypothetical protein